MQETSIIAFTTFFATIGPIDVAAVFAALTSHTAPELRRAMALRGIAIATVILLVFAFFGELLLARLGISLPALHTAGGVLLLLISIDMVFARNSGGVSTTEDESREAASKTDISVFPLATPLIAGPGAMGAAILLIANTQGNIRQQVAVVGALLLVLLCTLFFLLGATQVTRMLGVTGQQVLTRIFGVLLSALAIQFLFDGIAQSGLLSI